MLVGWMPNAYAFYLGILAIATGLVVVGLIVLRKAVRGERDARGQKYGRGSRWAGILFMLLGGALGAALMLTSPTPWQRRALFDHIFHTPPGQIISVTVKPGGKTLYLALVRQPVKITDRATIGEIAGVLDRAVDWSPNHPQTEWTTTVELETTSGIYECEVHRTPPEANGTLVYVSHPVGSHGASWNLGAFRADGLETLLEAAARQATTPSATQPATSVK